jgi:V/A-type H+-transporting ATPase subunit I
MLFPAEMREVTIGVHRSFQNRLVRDLHEAGVMEITSIWDAKREITRYLREDERSPVLGDLADCLLKISGILDAVRSAGHLESHPIREMFAPEIREKAIVEERDIHALLADARGAIEEAGRAVEIRNILIAAHERQQELDAEIGRIRLLAPFEIDLAWCAPSPYTCVVPVMIESTDEGFVSGVLAGLEIPELVIEREVVDGRTVVVLATLERYREAVDAFLRSPDVHPMGVGEESGTPQEVMGRLSEEAERLSIRKGACTAELARLKAEWEARLEILREELEIEMDRHTILNRFGRTEEVEIIEGWIPAADVDYAAAICDRAAHGHVFFESRKPAHNPDGVPVKYDNPGWLAPFEMLTSMFSRPRYDEIDPTLIIGPVLVIYFGLMLGDVVYGLLIVLIAYLLYRGAGRISRSVHDFAWILMAAGGATVLFGMLQGGYLGDALPRFLGVDPPFVIINSLEHPIQFLQIALVIGIIQINAGLLLGAYQHIRHRRLGQSIFEQGAWFIIQPCAAVLLFGFFGWAAFPAAYTLTAAAGCLIGAGLIFFHEGPLGFFSLTGFLGDWLSYARLLALALATGGIAMTVNILTGMVAGIHPAMVIGAAVVFVAGQLFNFVLQSLGAFVHSLRLQYVEFFGKFYTGGGDEFDPFVAGRSLTRIVEGDR